jgi:hypothetical protein
LRRLVPFLAAALLAHATRAEEPWFRDATEGSGLSFRHHAARSDEHFYPETFGAGVALLDVDGDERLDVLLLDTGAPPGAPPGPAPASALFLNRTQDGRLRFVRGPDPPLGGLAAMGACVGDVDGDGDDDVLVTGLPESRLLLNASGRLVAAEGNGGIADPGWSTSCAFLDLEGDGDLDLYVAHYVRWTAAEEASCGGEVPGFVSYCPPSRYAAEPDRLFVGDGKGHFRDASDSSGVAAATAGGKGLGVVAADLNEDGRTDVYVANDQVPNTLLLNHGDADFKEVALASGTAMSDEGEAQAGMGVDVGDVDGDGHADLWVTNLDLETNNLYVAVSSRGGVPRFRDGVHVAGLGRATLTPLGFGTVLADLDRDGDTDAFVANGHVLPEIAVVRPGQTHAMVDQLFENRSVGGRVTLVDAADRWHPASRAKTVGRGLASTWW